MEITSRNWTQQYESLKKKIQQKRINGEPFSSEEVQSINSIVEKLISQLSTMSKNPLQYEIVASEVARRQILMDNMKKQTAIIRANVTSETSSGMAVPQGRGTTFMSTSKSTYNPIASGDHKGKAVMQRQEQIMKLQDDMISDIEVGVDRLHGQALAMGDETKSHVRLLDDLDTNVEVATAALQAEAKHAADIKDKARVCWMYICIAVEVVILVLLMVVAFAT